ncbi:MAG: hypothetical protein AAB441_02215 [Patescibacteria group bacterium]
MPKEGEKTRFKEATSIKNPEVMMVPMINTKLPNFILPLFHYFEPNLYLQNDRLIKLSHQANLAFSKKSSTLSQKIVNPIGDISAKKAIEIIKRLQDAPKIEESLFSELGVTISGKVFPSQTTDYLTEKLKQLSKGTCILSPSHESDLYLVEALGRIGINPNEIGVVFVDQHIDSQGKENPAGQEIINKANFIRYILEQGIGAISLIGMYDRQFEMVSSGKKRELGKEEVDDHDYEKNALLAQSSKGASDLHELYLRFKERFFLGTGIFKEQKKINNLSIIDVTVKKQIENLKKREIKYVLLSLDMDSLNLLREEITATAYSPFSTIIATGLEDFNKILYTARITAEQFEKRVKELEKLRIQIDSLLILRKRKGVLRPLENELLKEKKKFLVEQYSRIYPIIYNFELATHQFTFPKDSLSLLTNIKPEGHKENIYLDILGSEEGGFTVSQAEYLIRSLQEACEYEDLEFGVPTGEGRVTGSISELEGLDLNGNTAHAVKRLANVINDI